MQNDVPTFITAILSVCNLEGWDPILLSPSRCWFSFDVGRIRPIEVFVSAHGDTVVSLCKSDLVLPLATTGRDTLGPCDAMRWLIIMDGAQPKLSVQFESSLKEFTAQRYSRQLHTLVDACIFVNDKVQQRNQSRLVELTDNDFIRSFVKGAGSKLGSAAAAALLGLLNL